MHTALILTKHPDEYARLVDAEALPDLSVVATADVGDATRVREALPHMSALRWVQLTWAGVEPMLDPSLRRDYVLTNIRGVFGPLMSEYVFGYLLAHERRILSRHAATRAGQWDATLPGTLRGKRLGLVGVGSIGTHLAATAKHFGMAVHGYTRASRESPDVDRYFHGSEKAGTRQVVDAEMLAALPAHAVVVNAGRGDTLDDAALIEALTAGRLAGAVLDVFPEEPLPAGHPLWRAPNVHITCHTAAPSFPGDIVGVFADNYRRFHAGQPLRYVVDFERGY
jgi:phosphoglycerate dehydrogenase-like enzyme